MPGAAPRSRVLAAVLAVTVVAVGLATRAEASVAAGSGLPELWSVSANNSFTARTLTRLRKAGVNSVVLDSVRLKKTQLARLTRQARSAHLRVIVPIALRGSSVAGVQATCEHFRVTAPGAACAVEVSSYKAAVAIAESGASDLVIFRVTSPGNVARLRLPRTGRLLVHVRVPGRYKRAAWRSAVRAASRSAALDLEAAPGAAGQRSFSAYLSTLQTSGVTRADHNAPSTPSAFTLLGTTTTTLTTRWRASSDNRGVAGYGFYVDGRFVGTALLTSYVARGLLCGTSHRLQVDAFDLAGNRSGK